MNRAVDNKVKDKARRRPTKMRKESRRSCDRFGEGRVVIFIIRTIGSSVGCGNRCFVHGLTLGESVGWNYELNARATPATGCERCQYHFSKSKR